MKTGTYEWAPKTKNLFMGCRNDCRYCYAREHAKRFGKIKTLGDWFNMIPYKDPLKGIPGEPTTIMFPSTHDIFEEHLPVTIPVLKAMLEKGHNLVIVSKARVGVMKHLVKSLGGHKKRVLFRITIGSVDNKVLSFWDTGAPSYEERRESLNMAYQEGFETSVSCEPFLDTSIRDLISDIRGDVSETIWIGKMNNVGRRVNTDGWTKKDRSFLHRMFQGQTDEEIRKLYCEYEDDQIIRWKDSIKRVMGLPGIK